jgi:hypothetical protein
MAAMSNPEFWATLYYSPAATLFGLECNSGIDSVMKNRDSLSRLGIDVVDATNMDNHGRQTEYMRAVTASVVRKYRIRQVFGSRRNAGFNFGRGVPALLVHGVSNTMPRDVYAHIASGRVVTIQEFLSQLEDKD